MPQRESKARVSAPHISKPSRREFALAYTTKRRGSLVTRHPKKRKKGRVIHAVIGEGGVRTAAMKAGIKLQGPFGL